MPRFIWRKGNRDYHSPSQHAQPLGLLCGEIVAFFLEDKPNSLYEKSCDGRIFPSRHTSRMSMGHMHTIPSRTGNQIHLRASAPAGIIWLGEKLSVNHRPTFLKVYCAFYFSTFHKGELNQILCIIPYHWADSFHFDTRGKMVGICVNCRCLGRSLLLPQARVTEQHTASGPCRTTLTHQNVCAIGHRVISTTARGMQILPVKQTNWWCAWCHTKLCGTACWVRSVTISGLQMAVFEALGTHGHRACSSMNMRQCMSWERNACSKVPLQHRKFAWLRFLCLA